MLRLSIYPFAEIIVELFIMTCFIRVGHSIDRFGNVVQIYAAFLLWAPNDELNFHCTWLFIKEPHMLGIQFFVHLHYLLKNMSGKFCSGCQELTICLKSRIKWLIFISGWAFNCIMGRGGGGGACRRKKKSSHLRATQVMPATVPPPPPLHFVYIYPKWHRTEVQDILLSK